MKKNAIIFCTLFQIIISVQIKSQFTFIDKYSIGKVEPIDILESRDGKYLYIASHRGIFVFVRDVIDGTLKLDSKILKMQDSTLIQYAQSMAISPDSGYIYVKGMMNDFVFKRNKLNGSLTAIQTFEHESYSGITNFNKNFIAVSNDNKNVYISAGQILYIFTRNITNGLMSLLEKYEIDKQNDNDFENSFLLSSDDKFVYVLGGSVLTSFKRDRETGKLQKFQTLAGQGVSGAKDIKESFDGRFIYVLRTIDFFDGVLSVLKKDPKTDSLSIIQNFDIKNYTCDGFVSPTSISLDSENNYLYVSSYQSSIAIFEIDKTYRGVKFLKTVSNKNNYIGGKKIFINNFMYGINYSYDSIYLYHKNLFFDSNIKLCYGDTVKSMGEYPTYLWSDFSKKPYLIINKQGQYKLQVIDKNGEVYKDSAFIRLYDYPDLELGEDIYLRPGQYKQLTVSDQFKQYIWNGVYSNSNYYIVKNDGSLLNETKIRLKVYSITCNASDSLLVRIYPLAITENIISNLKMFPNPAKEWVTIKFNFNNNENTSVEFYNMDGKLYARRETQLYDNKITMNINQFPKGTYLVKVYLKNKSFSGLLQIIK